MRLRGRTAVALVALSLLLSAVQPIDAFGAVPTSAQVPGQEPEGGDENPPGGDGGFGNGAGAIPTVAEFGATSQSEHLLEAAREALERENVYVPGEPACSHYESAIVTSDGEGNPIYGEICTRYYECGAERVDDVYTGRVAASEASGAYVEYLGWVQGALGQVGVDAPINALSDALLEAGLGPQPERLRMPLFSYCRDGEGGVVEVFDPVFGPVLGWDLAVVDEYDVDATRVILVDDLRGRIQADPPVIQTIPPVEDGRTYVRFPTWLWIDDLVEGDYVWLSSDLDTIRLSARALLTHVEWTDGDRSLTCETEQMVAWEGQDPIADAPDCHLVFGELGSIDLAATLHYRVEVNIGYRASVYLPFVETGWQEHVEDPIIINTATVPDFEVHQLLAVNVSNPVD